MKQRTTVWLVGNMPHTLHKVLFHGQEITENSFFPVGTLSEEAQECRNKDYLPTYKLYRLRCSRKCSLQVTNQDIMHRMIIKLDPLLSRRKPTFSTKRKSEIPYTVMI